MCWMDMKKGGLQGNISIDLKMKIVNNELEINLHFRQFLLLERHV